MTLLAASPLASAIPIEPRRVGGPAYRADIDSLRAVAIVPVVLYHADIAPFGGGFVGVDVFFVISGYLITSLIVAEIDRGAFSLRNFYVRRIRRIFPALFVMMAFCAAVGWVLLTPPDYKLLGQSIFAATFFSSNILFWRQSGYFDAPLEYRPLLHTWSLGVEEQFYLLFPVFLVLVCRYLPRWRIVITLALCILSFGFNVLAVTRRPEAAFYLAPFRIWELFTGALLAMGAVPSPRSTRVSEVACLMGAALIGIAVFAFSKETTFPGFAALLPTVGAAAIIWAGNGRQGSATRLLSRRAPVVIGKISYSLYLWHFPLLAFGAYVATAGLTLGARIGLIALSVVFAVGSWWYIEQPVHQGRWPFESRRLVFAAAAAALAVFGGFGLAVHLAGGFPGRLSEPGREILAAASDFNADRESCMNRGAADFRRIAPCRFGMSEAAPAFALWGDSHAEVLRGAIGQAASRAQRSGVFLGHPGCAPVLGVERLDDSRDCRVVNDAFMTYLLSLPSITTVILAGRWPLWAEGSRYKRETGPPLALASAAGGPAGNHAALAAGLERTIAALTAAGKKVWLVGPVPEIGYDVPRALYFESRGFPGGIDIRPTLEEFNVRQRFVPPLFAEMTKKYRVQIVWPQSGLCDARFCQVQKDGHLLYRDDQHLSRFGARSISVIFDPIFQ